MNFYNLLAESPWYIPAVLLLVGAVMLYSGAVAVARRVALALLGVGLVIIAVSWLLESDREAVLRRTREVIKAVDGKDWSTLEARLDPKVQFLVLKDREALMIVVRAQAERLGLKSVTLAGISETRGDGGTRLTEFQASADTGATSNFLSNWRLEWAKRDDQWLVTRIEFLGGPGLPDDTIRGIVR
jgi:hypothetical protein